MHSEEMNTNDRYRVVKRYIHLGKLDELRKRLEENHITTKEAFDTVATKWLEELDAMYGKQAGRPPLDHTEEERTALQEKMEHPEARAKCPRCGKELLRESIGNSIRIGCATPYCIYTGIRGL